MSYLVKGSAWLSVGQLIASASAFITTIVLANFLEPSNLGEYRFLLAGFALLCIAALPGTRTALRESTPKGFRGNLPLAFNLMMRWGIIGSVISIVVAIYYGIKGDFSLSAGFIVAAMALPFNHASTAYIEYLTALKELKRLVIYTFIGRTILALSTVLAVFLFPDSVWIIFSVVMLGTILPNIFFHHRTSKAFVTESSKSDRDLPSYSKHLSVMTGFDYFAGQMDKIFVWSIVGTEGLAIFYIAYTLPQEVVRFSGIIPRLAFAKFGANPLAETWLALLPKIFKYFLIMVLFAGTYIIIVPHIFALIFPKYPDAVAYSQALILVAVGSAFLPLKTYLFSVKDTKALYWLSIICPAVRVIAAISLISTHGIWGAVYALILESVIRSGLLLFFFLKTKRN